MNAKKSKKVLLLASLSTLAVSAAAVLAINFGSESAYRAKAASEATSGSVTFNWQNVVSGSSTNKTFLGTSQRGGNFYMYSHGAGTIGTSTFPLVASFNKKNVSNSAIEFFTDSARIEKYEFQNVSSIVLGIASTSDNNVSLRVYSDEQHVFYNDYEAVKGESLNITDITGASYLMITPATDGWIDISSITINYLCQEDIDNTHYNLSYEGLDSTTYDVVPLVGIDTSKLPTSSRVDRRIKIKFVTLENYECLGFMFDDPDDELDIEKINPEYDHSTNVLSINMPDCDLKILIATKYVGTLVLDNISISNPTIDFNLNDTFSFDGTVTANYENGDSADVTSSATFSGYDMSVAGEQTVTVSYTEGEVTKTATYTITVSSFTPMYISGTFVFTTTSKVTITFNDDGTGSISYDKSNAFQTIVRTCEFTYLANANNRNVSITFSSINFTYLSNWGYLYIPFGTGFKDNSVNNNCSISADGNTFSMEIFEYISADKVYESRGYGTFTK